MHRRTYRKNMLRPGPGAAHRCGLGVRSWGVAGEASGDDFEDFEKQGDGGTDGDGQQAEGSHGYEVDLLAEIPEIFNQFLLLAGVAVSGFTDHFQAIFDAGEGGVLFDDLIAQLGVQGLELGEAVFDGRQVDRRCWRGSGSRGRRRGKQVGEGVAEVAFEQGEDALNDWQRGADQGSGAPYPGGELERSLRRSDGQSGAGCRGGQLGRQRSGRWRIPEALFLDWRPRGGFPRCGFPNRRDLMLRKSKQIKYFWSWTRIEPTTLAFKSLYCLKNKAHGCSLQRILV